MNLDELNDMLWGDRYDPDKTIIPIFFCQFCDFLTAENNEIVDHYYARHIKEIKERYDWDLYEIIYNLISDNTRSIQIPTHQLIDIAKEMNLIKDPNSPDPL